MSFSRDVDLDHFDDARKDPTARLSRPPSKSPQKPNGKERGSASEQLDDDGLESLRKRMAGPSSAKAGLGKDQTEINRIIYEVSKGSKFFENEKKRDADTTRRIEALLKRKDERMKELPEGGAEWRSIERRVDEMLANLEATRDLSRSILHCDMDMFYAAVELHRDPSLKGKCFAVGSGVLVTASYEARKYGVRSGMAGFVAKALCPHLIFVKNQMEDYVAASKEVMEILERYDPSLAQASLDEAYLDITDYCTMNEMDVEEVVEQLRKEVQEETHLTVSVGIAPNKMLAKICSDKNKPNGQYRIPPDRRFIVDFMRELPVRKVPGIGRVNERMLESLGIQTCGDVWEHRVMLFATLGITDLLNAYLGLGSTVVQPGKREERKSVGRESTFRPTNNETELYGTLRKMADQVERDLERLDFRGRTVSLVAKKDTYQRFTRAKTMHGYIWKADDLYNITSSLLAAEGPITLRLIGVRVTGLKDMRQPADGGPIKRMLTSAANSPTKNRSQSRSGPGEFGELDALDEQMDEEKQLALALKRSLQDAGEPFFEEEPQLVAGPSTNSDALNARRRSRSSSPGFLSPDEGTSPPPQTQARASRSVSSETPAASFFSYPVVKPSQASSSKIDAPICPICDRPVQISPDSTPAASNAALNSHIDACLSGDALAIIPTTKTAAENKPKSKKAGLGGPLDNFVLKKRRYDA